MRPEKVTNSGILGEYCGLLKNNLIINHDFVIIEEKAYRFIQQWYDVD